MTLEIEYDEKGMSPHTIESLWDYIEEKKPINSFLKAVLSNDLKEAYVCAVNDVYLLEIPGIISFIHCRAPTTCWGSREKVEKWLQEGLKMDDIKKVTELTSLSPIIEIGGKTIKVTSPESVEFSYPPDQLDSNADITISFSIGLYNYQYIPKDTLKRLVRYINHREPPCHFLECVLRDQLTAAYTSANKKNAFAIPSIVYYLTEEAPKECWGSPEKVEKWLIGHAKND